MANKRPIVISTGSQPLETLTDADALHNGQGAMLAEQSVSLGTPSSGYGSIYAKTDGKVYFKNDAGTEYDLTATGGGGSGTDPIIREYTANDTWTKPTASNYYACLVICFGAGGGGGSGRRGLAGTTRMGGGGGGGGAMVARYMRKAQTPNATYAITIGVGGTGANGVDTDDTNGVAGSAGTDTSLGSLVIAKGGSGGGAGTTSGPTAATGGPSASCTPSYGPFAISGGNANSQSTISNTSSPQDGFGGNFALPAGGPSGSIRSSTNQNLLPSAGGAIWNDGVRTAGGAAGVTGSGTANGTDGTNVTTYVWYDSDNPITASLGTGGGGGASAPSPLTPQTAGKGGNGGRGAGGGGGGSTTNTGTTGNASGGGGNGGNGLCVIVEFYGA